LRQFIYSKAGPFYFRVILKGIGMKTAAVLLDGGFVLKRLYLLAGRRHPTAEDVYAFAKSCVTQTEEQLFRIYFYDCPPYEESARNPLSPEERIDFSQTAVTLRKRRLQQRLSQMDYVAFRSGELRLQGWRLKEQALARLSRRPRPIAPEDLKPGFRQKRVDMKIGLDVAWLASKRIVDRLVLVTGDTDFVPAMKFARREGTQVVLVPMQVKVKDVLREHADFVRDVVFPPAEGSND
jgi:uncharacterized LabA/DUF88 family protein